MSDLKICRICFKSKGVKMFDHNQYHLKHYYEEVMGKKMNETDGLPLQFCHACAAMLHKFHKFKEKCYMAETVLQKMKWGGPITLSSISLIQKQNKNLQSTIDLIVMSKRIRTCIVKHKSASKSQNKQNKKGDQPEIEASESDYDSDNSLNDKYPSEFKNEIISVNLDSLKQEVIDEHTSTVIDEEQALMSIGNVNIDEKSIPDLEDGGLSSSNEELNTESANDVEQPAIEEDSIIDEYRINHYSNNDIKKETHKKQKDKNNKKKNKKKFANRDTTSNNGNLDPKHWLKINLSEEEALEEFNAKAQDKKYLSAAYHCTDCYKHFSKEDMLNRHMKLRHCPSLGPIECRFCKMRFKWKCYLTRHIVQHYTKYKCLRCDTVCPLLTTAVFHNSYHNGVTRKCKYCGEEFRHPSTYYTHLRTHRSEHVCTLCGASFVSVVGLSMHKRNMHVNTIVNPEEAVNTYCERCDIKFQTQKAYEEHMFHSVKHAEGVEDLADETPGPSIPKRRRKLFHERSIKTPCPKCNITFRSKKAFLEHHSSEHKDERLPSQEQRYVCEICGASLTLNSVPAHLKTHTQEKRFSCPSCPMQFTTKSSARRHQVTHTGEKNFKCSMCDKRYAQKASVYLHYRTIHLKQPYPKRNRRKKSDFQLDIEFFRTG